MERKNEVCVTAALSNTFRVLSSTYNWRNFVRRVNMSTRATSWSGEWEHDRQGWRNIYSTILRKNWCVYEDGARNIKTYSSFTIGHSVSARCAVSRTTPESPESRPGFSQRRRTVAYASLMPGTTSTVTTCRQSREMRQSRMRAMWNIKLFNNKNVMN